LVALISDLNRAMYVIYAQFLGPSLAYKASPKSNRAPERAPRPYIYKDFHSPGSSEDSELEYAASSAHAIIDAAQSQPKSLAKDAPPGIRQPPKRSSATMGTQMSATRPHTYRRTDTNDDTQSAPQPTVLIPSARLMAPLQAPPASPTSPTATQHSQTAIIRDEVPQPAHTPKPHPPRVPLEYHLVAITIALIRDSKDYDPEPVQHASPSAATPRDNTMGTCGVRQTRRTNSVTNRITMPPHTHRPTYSASTVDTSNSTGPSPNMPTPGLLLLQPTSTHTSKHATRRAVFVCV
jgi:hypothetical protein